MSQGAAQFVRQAPAKRVVFVSYSHDDFQDCRTLVEYLGPASSRLGTDALWVDFEELQGGVAWRKRIDEGLARATVFIVLMSQKYLGSRFCMDDELAPILRKVRQGKALVIPIALHRVELADFAVDDGEGGRLALNELQCLPQGTYEQNGGERLGLVPLSQWRGDRRDAWHAVQSQIEKALNSHQRSSLKVLPAAQAVSGQLVQDSPVLHATRPSARRLEIPYLCNRGSQSMRLDRVAKTWEAQACRRPLVVVTEAISEDRPDKWTQRLGDHEFVQMLTLFDRDGLSFGDPKPFSWPSPDILDADEAQDHLVRAWYLALGGKLRTVDASHLHVAHRERGQPLLLWCDVDLKDTEEAALDHAVRAFGRLTAQWPDALSPGVLVIALNLRHPADADELCRQRAQTLVDALRGAAEGDRLALAYLGSLPPVRQGDLDPWADLPAVQPLLRDADLERLREQLQQPQRMKRFARLCDEWLDPESQTASRR